MLVSDGGSSPMILWVTGVQSTLLLQRPAAEPAVAPCTKVSRSKLSHVSSLHWNAESLEILSIRLYSMSGVCGISKGTEH